MLTKTSNAPESPLTKEQLLQELQDQQLNGTVATVTGNVDDSHAFPAPEKHLLQVKLVTRTNNAETKQYEDVSSVVALSPADYERMEKNESFLGYDKVEILHDPRPKSRQKADEAGDVKTDSPMEPNTPLRSIQDAQMRYKVLTGEDAPADKSFEELVEAIGYFESPAGKAELKKKADAATKTQAAADKAAEAAQKAADAAKGTTK